MTTTLEGGEWSAARHGRTLPPGKTRCPFYGRLGGSQGRSGRAQNLVPTGIRSRTVQPVVSRYTDWATGPTVQKCTYNYYTRNVYKNKHVQTAPISQQVLPSVPIFQVKNCSTVYDKILIRMILSFTAKVRSFSSSCSQYQQQSGSKNLQERKWN